MNSITTSIETKDMKVKFQTLWIFVMFNYLYADVLGLHDPAILKELITGQAGSLQITQGFLLGAAILMETAIAMVLLSRVLKYRANRWANIIAGTITILYVIGGGSTTPHYLFFATLEVVGSAFIIWYAWTWANPEIKRNAPSYSVETQPS